ncbi:hypothetical protein [Candidatus Palauibacter sp.]|uniref:hypothetical protein n=1 Tax=Candidatus Palauibacter sp. TaxID=3101350 RepID=UPI003CC55D64
MRGITLATSENAELHFSGDGATFLELPFVGGISASGGEAPETDVVGFKGSAKLVGRPRIPSLSVEVVSYAPQLDVWRTITDAARARTPLWWRITTFEESLLPASGGNTAAIDTAGAVTFAGLMPDFTSDEYAEGLVIELGGAKYVVDAISASGVVTVQPAPESDVSASAYEIINPSLRLGPFVAHVRSAGNFDLPAEGNLTSALELSPRAQLPHWAVA